MYIALAAIVLLTACQTGKSRDARKPAEVPQHVDDQIEQMIRGQHQISTDLTRLNSFYTTTWLDVGGAKTFLIGPNMVSPRTNTDFIFRRRLREGIAKIEQTANQIELIGSSLAQTLMQRPDVLEEGFFHKRMLSRRYTPREGTKDPADIHTADALYIRNLAPFAYTGEHPSAVFPVDNLNHQMSLELENWRQFKDRDGKLKARLICNVPVDIKRRNALDINKTASATFDIPPLKKEFKPTVFIQFPKKPVNCELFLTSVDGSERGAIRLVTSENSVGDKLGQGLQEVCLYDKNLNVKGPTELFINIHTPTISCAAEPDYTDLAVDSFLGFSRKIEMLTGKPIPREVMDKQDGDYRLDFSEAPKLDLILLSYLEYRSDFSGHMVGQALLHHAKRGTQVRIIVPALINSPFVSKRDMDYIHSLMDQTPNIRLQRFWSEYENRDLPETLHRLHRSVHTKIMVTLSKSDANGNAVIIGGRNIKDTFIFHKMPDYSKRPDYIQYGKEEPYIYFADAEIFLRGREIAEQLAGQLLSFYNRDSRNTGMRQVSAHVPGIQLTPEKLAELKSRLDRKPYVRHILSIPYKDGRAFEDVMVAMLNSAKTKVRITNPYFNPTPKLALAFRAAVERGIKIELISRLSFKGDNSPTKWVEEVNKRNFNKFVGAMTLYNWTDNSILHAKTMSIDDEVLYIGGANFNGRTMVHDVENGYIVTGQETIRQFNESFDGYYLKHSEKIDDEMKLRRAYQILLKIIDPLKVF